VHIYSSLIKKAGGFHHKVHRKYRQRFDCPRCDEKAWSAKVAININICTRLLLTFFSANAILSQALKYDF